MSLTAIKAFPTRILHAKHAQVLVLVVLWILMLGIFGLTLPRFFSAANLTSILQFTTITALVALGQTLVILCGGGGIDLSVGGIVSLCSLLLASLLVNGMPAVLACFLAVLFGCMLGAINGLLITRIRITPLIATLATSYAYRGTALAVVAGAPISGVPETFSPLGRQTFVGIPLHVLFVLLPVSVILLYLLTQLPMGRWIYAIGQNERGARLVGIPVDSVRFSLYALSGLLCSLAAIVATSWLLSARPNIGDNLDLESLTIVLLGGTSIFGGRGSLAGTLLAAYFLVALEVGLQLANINAIWQLGALGALLIISVLLDFGTKER